MNTYPRITMEHLAELEPTESARFREFTNEHLGIYFAHRKRCRVVSRAIAMMEEDWDGDEC